MNIRLSTVQQPSQERVFGGAAQAEWNAANLLESQVWAVLAVCGAMSILDYFLRFWVSFAGLAA